MSTLDLTRGYWHIGMTDGGREKSAFITPFGHYEMNVMPFGMVNSGATFRRLMDRTLSGCEEFANAYIDDIIIASQTWPEHVIHVEEVLTRLRRANLTAKPSKCELGRTEVHFLGYIVGKGCIKPQPEKLEAVNQYPRPLVKKEVRAFLGLSGSSSPTLQPLPVP